MTLVQRRLNPLPLFNDGDASQRIIKSYLAELSSQLLVSLSDMVRAYHETSNNSPLGSGNSSFTNCKIPG